MNIKVVFDSTQHVFIIVYSKTGMAHLKGHSILYITSEPPCFVTVNNVVTAWGNISQ
jgi:hypothetical protein